MKKIIVLFLLMCLISVSLFAGDWVRLNAASVIDVAVAENGTTALVNKTGELWISKDAGRSFKKDAQVEGGVRISVNSDGSVLGLVNRSGEFWISKDGGNSWAKTQAVGAIDSSVGKTNSFLVNKGGEIYFTSDYKNWTKTNATDGKCVVFGGPFIFLTNKKGESFVADFKNDPLMAYKKTQATGVVDIDIAPNGNLWIVNGSGELWFSADKGVTWKKEAQAKGVSAVALCNKYTIIANTGGEVYIKQN